MSSHNINILTLKWNVLTFFFYTTDNFNRFSKEQKKYTLFPFPLISIKSYLT